MLGLQLTRGRAFCSEAAGSASAGATCAPSGRCTNGGGHQSSPANRLAASSRVVAVVQSPVRLPGRPGEGSPHKAPLAPAGARCGASGRPCKSNYQLQMFTNRLLAATRQHAPVKAHLHRLPNRGSEATQRIGCVPCKLGGIERDKKAVCQSLHRRRHRSRQSVQGDAPRIHAAGPPGLHASLNNPMTADAGKGYQEQGRCTETGRCLQCNTNKNRVHVG